MEFQGSETYKTTRLLRETTLWTAYDAVAESGETVELRLLRLTEFRHDHFFNWLQKLKFCEHVGLRRLIESQLDGKEPFVALEAISAKVATSIAPLLDEQNVAELFDGLAAFHRFGLTSGTISGDILVPRERGTWCLDPMLVWSDRSRDHVDTEGNVSELAAVIVERLRSQNDPFPAILSILHAVRDHTSDSVTASKSGHTVGKPLLTAARVAQDIRAALKRQLPSTDVNIAEPRTDDVERTLVADAATMSSQAVPDQLGRFQLHERLGEGAVGAVYRATDCTDDSEVAIKVLNSRLAQNPTTLRRFTKEARMLARAESPFVAKLLESNSDQGLHYLALEFVPGGTLSTVIRGSLSISEPVAIRLGLDVALGLSVAHRDSVFHRDIKPDNILLTQSGVTLVQNSNGGESGDAAVLESSPMAKLSDFGLARATDQSESLDLTQDGTILGTPLYMSPEQCRGLPADARSDVYSLGATLFHLLAGRPPFQGETHVAVMHAHCTEALPSLKQLRPSLSDAIITLVEKCLARNPDARYNDAEALAADLQKLLLGEPSSIVLHPAMPKADGLNVVEYRFTCDLQSPPERLWPYVSNTDRINHSIGLASVTYTTRTHPERGVERFAETRIAGQKLAWQEHPYEWVEGRRLSVLREFSSGPFAWFMNIVELQPMSGGGTRIVQTLRATPKNLIGRLVAKLEMARKAPRNFSRVYSQIDSYLIQGAAAADPFGTRTAMTASGKRRLLERTQAIGANSGIDPVVVETFRQFLENASDIEIARIRPLVFAERFQLPPDEVIKACLLGAREGLLVHLWDILCPSCRIPADVQETLSSLKDHAYCSACDLKYELDFASSVELIFRAHPEIRNAETKTYCIGGPAFSAHVVAQVRLAAGERFDLETSLSEGVYRLRGPQLPFGVEMTVSASRGVSRLSLSLLRPPAPGMVPVLRQGSQVLVLDNNTSHDLLLRLERTAGRQQAVTAAAVAGMPLFRELFPNEVLSPGQMVSIASVTLLMVDLVNADTLYRSLGDGPAFGLIRQQLMRIDEIVRRHGGVVVRLLDQGSFCVFQNTPSAIRTAVEILVFQNDELPSARAAIDHGSAMVTTINERLDYFGAIIARVRRLMERATERELIMPARLAIDVDNAQILQDAGVRSQFDEFPEGRRSLPIVRIQCSKKH